jgi:hypothetical protein
MPEVLCSVVHPDSVLTLSFERIVCCLEFKYTRTFIYIEGLPIQSRLYVHELDIKAILSYILVMNALFSPCSSRTLENTHGIDSLLGCWL